MAWLILLPALTVLDDHSPLEPTAAERLQELNDRFQSNLARIPRAGLLKVRHEDYTQDALDFDGSKPIGRAIETEYLYAFDSPDAYWEVQRRIQSGEPREQQEVTSAHPEASYRIRGLSNAQVELSVEFPADGSIRPNLWLGSSECLTHVPLPLLQRRLPTEVIQVADELLVFTSRGSVYRHLAQPWSLVDLVDDQEVDGTPVVMITIEFQSGLRTYWIDPNRGALPLRIREIVYQERVPSERKNDGSLDESTSIAEIDYGEIREIAEDVWFPFLEVRRASRYREPTNISLRHRTRITDAEFGKTPDPELFQIQLEKPLALSPPTRAQEPIGKARAIWDLQALSEIDLDAWRSAIELDSQTGKSPKPVLIHDPSSWTSVDVIVGCSLILFLGIAVWQLRNRLFRV